VVHAGQASGDKSRPAVRICHALLVADTGAKGLSEIAAAQRGLVTREQLRAIGIGRGAMDHRLKVGSLHRVLPALFSVVSPLLEPLAAETAALLHAGDDCVLSHGTAAALWGFADNPSFVAITVIGRNVRGRPGLDVHRVPELDVRDVRMKHGFPVTAPARTIIDLAGHAPASVVERALNEARVLDLVTDPQLQAAMERSPLRPGVAAVRAILEDEEGPEFTRSKGERELKRLLTRAELPWPNFNTKCHGFEVDAVWTQPRVVLEVDGYQFHGHRAAFERDRRKDQRLAAAGYTVIRITWRQLQGEPVAVAVRIAQALARAQRDEP
jgi:very-short-patch-repair endonuclease